MSDDLKHAEVTICSCQVAAVLNHVFALQQAVMYLLGRALVKKDDPILHVELLAITMISMMDSYVPTLQRHQDAVEEAEGAFVPDGYFPAAMQMAEAAHQFFDQHAKAGGEDLTSVTSWVVAQATDPQKPTTPMFGAHAPVEA